MKNMQSIRSEDFETPLNDIQQKVVKKEWLNPQIFEISKFSILSGIETVKFESDGASFVAS